jgi:hypothetical protein
MVDVRVGVRVDVAVFGGGPVGVRVGLPVEVGVLVAATAVAVRVSVGVLVEAIGVAVRVMVGVLLACVVFVGSGVLVLVAVGVDVLPPPGRTSRNTPVIGPHVWKPPYVLTPRPLSRSRCLPTDSPVVSTFAFTGTVCDEPKLPLIGMPVPPAHGGLSM